MRWVSRLKSTFDWISKATWSFGCPGHGKGVWYGSFAHYHVARCCPPQRCACGLCRDGLGGVVKRRLREDITNGIRAGEAVDIKTARHCYEHIVKTLGNEDWAQKHKSFKVSRFHCLWGTTADFGRPAAKEEFEPLTGCRESRQFIAMRDDVIGHRSFACWCHACGQSKAGHGICSGSVAGSGSVLYTVGGCTSKESRQWTEVGVSALTASRVAVTRSKAQAQGKQIAEAAVVGKYVIAQTRTDDTDQFAVGIFVDTGDKTPIVKITAAGDYVLAVRWLVRDESDAERRTFYDVDPDSEEPENVIEVISTELRHANFDMQAAPARFSEACNAKVPEDAAIGGDSDEEDDVDSDSEEDEEGEEGEECAQDDTGYVHGRRLVLSVKDEQIALDWCW